MPTRLLERKRVPNNSLNRIKPIRTKIPQANQEIGEGTTWPCCAKTGWNVPTHAVITTQLLRNGFVQGQGKRCLG